MKRKHWKILVWSSILIFLLANVIVYNHAYRFTHFSISKSDCPQQPEELSFKEKLNALFLGVRVFKPQNTAVPTKPYKTFTLQSHEKLSGWIIPATEAKGLVVLFHGYISNKANMLSYADVFYEKGYTTVLIDFRGHGDSEGLETTIGFKEGRDVKECFDYVKKEYPTEEIILFGCSMGAAAIMKSIAQYDIKPDKIILECPFGSMLQTAKLRFAAMGVSPTPFAQWLILYGGLQTGFNAFAHNPRDYARVIKIPTALFVGEQDKRVTRHEIDEIYKNLKGQKSLNIFKNSGHEIYLNNDAAQWHHCIDNFLDQ